LCVDGVAAALDRLGRAPVDVVLCDDEPQPDAELGSAEELLERVRESCVDVPVVVMVDDPNGEAAASAMRRGAMNVVSKPLHAEVVRLAVNKALEISRLRRENEDYRRGTMRGGTIVGSSPALTAALASVTAVAPTLAPVLVEGEHGTGKELFARAIHERSQRSRGLFETVDCTSLPDSLVDSLIFGHEPGAFPGAQTRLRGALERANPGTVLLDEVSALLPPLQERLFRALQDGVFEPVGGGRLVRSDVRVIATTNRNLRAEVEAGRFHRDLYHWLSVVTIRVPPLRERLEDLPALVDYFVRKSAAHLGIVPPLVPEETLEALRSRWWPGNVRELMDTIDLALVLHGRGRILPPMLDAPDDGSTHPSSGTGGSAGPGVSSTAGEVLDLTELERHAIDRALEVTGGNRTRAARLLGITPRTLRNKLRGDDSKQRAG
jgi:DNA-binding NtrC family response regulator